MTTTEALRNLDRLSWDQIAVLYTILDGRVRAATTATGRTRALNARKRVTDHACFVRNVTIQRQADGTFLCGPASHFVPIAS